MTVEEKECRHATANSFNVPTCAPFSAEGLTVVEPNTIVHSSEDGNPTLDHYVVYIHTNLIYTKAPKVCTKSSREVRGLQNTGHERKTRGIFNSVGAKTANEIIITWRGRRGGGAKAEETTQQERSRYGETR